MKKFLIAVPAIVALYFLATKLYWAYFTDNYQLGIALYHPIIFIKANILTAQFYWLFLVLGAVGIMLFFMWHENQD